MYQEDYLTSIIAISAGVIATIAASLAFGLTSGGLAIAGSYISFFGYNPAAAGALIQGALGLGIFVGLAASILTFGIASAYEAIQSKFSKREIEPSQDNGSTPDIKPEPQKAQSHSQEQSQTQTRDDSHSKPDAPSAEPRHVSTNSLNIDSARVR